PTKRESGGGLDCSAARAGRQKQGGRQSWSADDRCGSRRELGPRRRLNDRVRTKKSFAVLRRLVREASARERATAVECPLTRVGRRRIIPPGARLPDHRTGAGGIAGLGKVEQGWIANGGAARISRMHVARGNPGTCQREASGPETLFARNSPTS